MLSSAAALEPACLRAMSPMLIDCAYQLVELLIAPHTRRCDKIFVANGIEHIEVALAHPLSGGVGEPENYASYVLHGADAVGQVFTFVAAFRGVRMQRMKRRTLEHLIRAVGVGRSMGC